MTIVCASGHRPDKLGGYKMGVLLRLEALAQSWLRSRPDVEEVIVGMAQGWDTAVAVACISVGLPFTAAVPFFGQDALWPAPAQRVYVELLGKAKRTHVIERAFNPPIWKMTDAMNRRNTWMVDNSHEVLALWNGSGGGTRNCLDYAHKVRRPIHNLWSKWAPNETH